MKQYNNNIKEYMDNGNFYKHDSLKKNFFEYKKYIETISSFKGVGKSPNEIIGMSIYPTILDYIIQTTPSDSFTVPKLSKPEILVRSGHTPLVRLCWHFLGCDIYKQYFCTISPDYYSKYYLRNCKFQTQFYYSIKINVRGSINSTNILSTSIMSGGMVPVSIVDLNYRKIQNLSEEYIQSEYSDYAAIQHLVEQEMKFNEKYDTR